MESSNGSDLKIYDVGGFDRIGDGGTKTIYPVEEDLVVFAPNSVDGRQLVNMWPRIVAEELRMSQIITDLGIPTLTMKKCGLRWGASQLDTLCCESFASFKKDSMYVFDNKSTYSCQWPLDIGPVPTSEDDEAHIKSWMAFFTPLLNDLKTLQKAGIALGGDTTNMIFCRKGSRWHSGSDIDLEARLFLFDYASKRYCLDFDTLGGDSLITDTVVSMFRRTVYNLSIPERIESLVLQQCVQFLSV